MNIFVSKLNVFFGSVFSIKHAITIKGGGWNCQNTNLLNEVEEGNLNSK